MKQLLQNISIIYHVFCGLQLSKYRKCLIVPGFLMNNGSKWYNSFPRIDNVKQCVESLEIWLKWQLPNINHTIFVTDLCIQWLGCVLSKAEECSSRLGQNCSRHHWGIFPHWINFHKNICHVKTEKLLLACRIVSVLWLQMLDMTTLEIKLDLSKSQVKSWCILLLMSPLPWCRDQR